MEVWWVVVVRRGVAYRAYKSNTCTHQLEPLNALRRPAMGNGMLTVLLFLFLSGATDGLVQRGLGYVSILF